MGASDFIDFAYGFGPVGGVGAAASGRDTQSFQNSAAALTGPAQTNYHYAFGDYLSGAYNAARQQANQNNADYAEWVRNEYSASQQRAYEQYMSNTQVQRAMKDLEAAGLNPWLAVQSAGFGGAVPTGAAASSSAGQMASAGGNSSSMAATAFGIAAIIKAIAKIIK